MIVDRLKDRLALAEEIGVMAIDDSKESAVETILELTDGEACP
jgi:threonine dehydrogenase-like Zn-dependent dehydrogenase